MARTKKTRSRASMNRLVVQMERKEARRNEPVVTDKSFTNIELIRLYTWYGENFSSDEAMEFVVEYIKSLKGKFPRDKFDMIKRCTGREILTAGISVGWTARLLVRGAKLDAELLKRFGKKIYTLVDLGKAKAAEAQSANSVSIRDRIKARAADIATVLNGAVDDFTSDGTAFDVDEFVRKSEISAPVAKLVYDRFKPVFDEVNEALTGDDDDLVAAYKSFSKRSLKKYVAFLESILKAFGTAEKAAKASRTRKPRKTKVKTVDQLTAKVKYAKSFGDVNSVSPAKVIGAKQVWTFNTKTRVLGVYNAAPAHDISIKGTTLQGWDDTTSEGRKLRKPEEQVKSVVNAGKVALRTLMQNIRAKPKALTGRLNSDTIIVKVI